MNSGISDLKMLKRKIRTGTHTFAAAILALLVLGTAFNGVGLAQAEENVASWITGPAIPAAPEDGVARLSPIVDAADVDRYRKIFAAQKKGRWKAAKRLIGSLDDSLLMGHVLAQRYLHPTKYRSRYDELAKWMNRYADHPDAKRIYRLALRRKPRGAKAPPRPQSFQGGTIWATALEAKKRRRRLTGRFTRGRAERKVRRYVRRLVRRERLSIAERYLNSTKIQRAVSRSGIDRTRAIIAAGWFRLGEFHRALALAAAAAKRSGKAAPEAQWWAGFSAFKLQRYDDAARYFTTAARAPSASPHETSRAAFWAARTNLVARNPKQVNAWLIRAAHNPRTFYGLISSHMLGGAPAFNWNKPALAAKQTTALLDAPASKRALALIQVGQGRRAQRELGPLRNVTKPRHLRAIITLANAARLPAIAYRAAKLLKEILGERIDAALYPVPAWTPDGGYSMDRALVFALARQESAFNAQAMSRSGARGLLQLMPATARYMHRSRRAFRGRDRSRLFEPGVNLALGQKYMGYLLSGDVVAGNLVMMISAYNGGPGNTAKWQRKMPHGADPLVFIESIPALETRLFVKRVLENFWIYRMRLGQKTMTLTALASGRWPYYVGLDTGAPKPYHQ